MSSLHSTPGEQARHATTTQAWWNGGGLGQSDPPPMNPSQFAQLLLQVERWKAAIEKSDGQSGRENRKTDWRFRLSRRAWLRSLEKHPLLPSTLPPAGGAS